jgi:transposase-like protein
VASPSTIQPFIAGPFTTPRSCWSNQLAQAPVTSRWHVDETYIKVRGQWYYLYRAIDSNGDPVEFWFSERRNLTAAKRFLRKALKRHGRPERIVIDGSHTNREAILSCDATNQLEDRSGRKLKPIRIRQSAYLNNRIEQDHRAIKRRVRPMLGFKSTATTRVILSGIEMVHMMRKGQAKYACNPQPPSPSNLICSLHEEERRSPPSLQLQLGFATEPRKLASLGDRLQPLLQRISRGN